MVRPGDLNHRPLLADPNIRTWYDEIALRSRLSPNIHLGHLGRFCHLMEVRPADIPRLAKSHPDRFHRLLVRYAQKLQADGRLNSYIIRGFTSMKLWLRFNRVKFDEFPHLQVIPGESIREERVPTQEELRRILSTFSVRARVVGLFMAHTGVRPGVLANSNATDGLRLSDLKDLVLTPEPRFEHVPFHVVVPGRLSKTRVEYHTFGTPELADALLAYLADRRRRGEELAPASPVVTVDPRGKWTHFRQGAKFGFVTTSMMMLSLRPGVKAILPSARTYVLRAYCSTQMVSARIDRDVREAILGHSLGISGRYNLSKKLHPTVIEELRREYAKAVPYLESGRPKEDRSVVLESVVEALLKDRGVEKGKITEILAGKVGGKELERILGSRKAPVQQVVPTSGLSALLAEGWEFVSAVGADQAVVRSPGASGGTPAPESTTA